MDSNTLFALQGLVNTFSRLGVKLVDHRENEERDEIYLSLLGPYSPEPAWFENSLNVLGKNTLTLLPARRSWELGWKVKADGRYFTLQLSNCNEAWWDEGQIYALTQLCQVGLGPRPVVDANFALGTRLLTEVYASVGDASVAYANWLAQISHYHLEDARQSCDPALYQYGLCCREHMIMMMQRSCFYDWFKFFGDENRDKTKPEEPPYMAVVPSQGEVLDFVEKYLVTYNTTADFLNVYLTRSQELEKRGWDIPTKSCSPGGFCHWKCCPTHVALSATFDILEQRALMLEQKHHISSRYTLKEHPNVGPHAGPSHGSKAWAALLIQLEDIDWKDLRLPPDYSQQGVKEIFDDYVLVAQ